MRYWWQSTFLLIAFFALAACSGAAPETESTLVEAPSTAPILPTSSPEPSPTTLPTVTTTLTPSPQPSLTATSEPTATLEPTTELTPTPRVYNGEMGYINFEPTDPALIEAELSKPEYTNAWPLTKDTAGDYGLTGIITNHQRVNIELPDGHVIILLSEFYYKDVNDKVQHIHIPIFMQNRTTGYSFISINSNLGIEFIWTEEEIVDGLIKTWFYLDTEGKVIESAVLDFKRSTNPNYVVQEGEGPIQDRVHADYYLKPILDGLGATTEQIWDFAQGGNPESLLKFQGMNFLIPNVIVAPETD